MGNVRRRKKLGGRRGEARSEIRREVGIAGREVGDEVSKEENCEGWQAEFGRLMGARPESYGVKSAGFEGGGGGIPLWRNS